MDNGPLTLVIIGASGDLTARKLVPSLYRLDCKKRLPDGLRIVGAARSPYTDDSYRNKMAEAVRQFAKADWSEQTWKEFAGRLFYAAGDASKPGGLKGVQDWLQRQGAAQGRVLFYLAVGPDRYEAIVTNLGESGLAHEDGGWRRIVIEKPFGRDLASARHLNKVVQAHFHENQVYRIDHYLGKETVQNILVLRFANILFEPVWNANFIDHVQLTVTEKVALEGRGGYYDESGVLRDMFQNHLLQLLTLVAMEAAPRYAADPLRNEKVKVLQSITPPTVEEARELLACGQYAGCRSEKGVAPDSRTPTFAALRLEVDNWRWRGVPFYLRSGKALAKRNSEVVVQFRCPPHLMFPLPPGATLQCNRLSLCIQPDEGIHLSFQSKVPDKEGMVLCPAELDFHYRETYADVPIPESYERLLLDALHGDAALFMRSDEIEQAWAIMDPFIKASETGPPPEEYPVGSDGPANANALLAREGRTWLSLCHHEKH